VAAAAAAGLASAVVSGAAAAAAAAAGLSSAVVSGATGSELWISDSGF